MMSDDIQVLFGTEKIYLFMRLYVLLVTMLYQAKDIADRKGACDDNPGLFTKIVSSLEELLKGKIDSKAFHEECTKNMENQEYNFVAIPPLVENCAAALVRMAKEDFLENLYHCSQLKLKVCVPL
jgi:histone deacetylase complex regulatory component SIN3